MISHGNFAKKTVVFPRTVVHKLYGVIRMKNKWTNIAIWVAISEATGALAGWLSRDSTEIYNLTMQKPPLSPPEWVFPVVWPILYALMGIGAGLVAAQPPSKARSRGLNLMVAQLILNFFWSLLFFNLQAFGFSLLWLILLWGLVLLMILEFRKTVPLAAWLQIPYLLWLTFAFYLNAGVWLLNC